MNLKKRHVKRVKTSAKVENNVFHTHMYPNHELNISHLA